MATVQTAILEPSLRKIGVEAPTATELANALLSLNALIASWGANGLMIFSTSRENFPLVVGTGSYTIGTGGVFNTSRPTSISNGYLRDGSTDSPLSIEHINNHNDIQNKTDSGRPGTLFYLPEYPLAKIVFDLLPDKTYTLFLDSLKRISSFALVSTVLSLPEEYERTFVFNLAIDMASEYNEKISPEVFRIANDTKEEIMGLNSAVRMTDTIQLDRAITRRVLR